MTVSSTFPPVSPDPLFPSESPSHPSPQNCRRSLGKQIEKQIERQAKKLVVSRGLEISVGRGIGGVAPKEGDTSPSTPSSILRLMTPSYLLSKQVASLLPAFALCLALCSMACASIFIVIAEQELSPIATAFNRLLITTIAFTLWNRLQTLNTPHAAVSPIEILIVLSGIYLAISAPKCNQDCSPECSRELKLAPELATKV